MQNNLGYFLAIVKKIVIKIKCNNYRFGWVYRKLNVRLSINSFKHIHTFFYFRVIIPLPCRHLIAPQCIFKSKYMQK